MSLLANHGLIQASYAIPSVRQVATATGTASDTYVFTPSIAPLEGNFLIFNFGGTQARGVVTAPSGCVAVTITGITGGGSGFSNQIYYKIATASEPASYSFILNGTLSGAGRFNEWRNIDAVSPVQFTGGHHTTGGVTTVETISGGFDITIPGVAFTNANFAAGTAWTPDNGYTNDLPASVFAAGYKIYPAVSLGETVNWAGASATVKSVLAFFKGKKI